MNIYQYGQNFPHYLANFDGIHYINIATRGYITEGAFFSLYPILISFGPFWVGLVISNLAFIGSIYLLVKLLKDKYSNNTIFWTIIFLLTFPTAFFFHAVYSESLFLFLALLTFYFASKKRYGLSILSATFLCATRFVGIFIIPALVIEMWGTGKKKLLAFFPAVSLIAYSIFNYFKWGDFLYFLHAHGQLGNGRETGKIIIFPQTMYRYLKIFLSLPISQYEWWIAMLEFVMFVIGTTLLLIGIKKRVPASWLVFSSLIFFFPALSGTFSGLPRYLIVVFPIYLLLAMIKSKWVKILLTCIFMIIQAILFMCFTKGYFVA